MAKKVKANYRWATFFPNGGIEDVYKTKRSAIAWCKITRAKRVAKVLLVECCPANRKRLRVKRG